MKIIKNNKGFNIILEKKYTTNEFIRLIQESSAIGNDKNSFIIPGSSFLWIGKDHHLNKKQVKELIDHLQYWLKKGKLKLPVKELSFLERLKVLLFPK